MFQLLVTEWSSMKICDSLLLGLLKFTILKAECQISIAGITAIIFLERQSLRSSFSAHMSFSTSTFFFVT